MELYAFTWSPDKRYHKETDPRYQLRDTLHIIKQLKYSVKGLLVPELNCNGNIHYHACITIHDKIKWYRQTLPLFKRNGFVLIKKINNEKGWKEYIKKDVPTNEEIFELQLPLPIEKIKIKKIKEIPSPQLDDGIEQYLHKTSLSLTQNQTGDSAE